MLGVRSRGKTFVSRTHGTEIASEEIKGLVMELNLMDLNPGVKQSFRKIKLCVDDVQGCNDLTDRCPEQGKTMPRADHADQRRLRRKSAQQRAVVSFARSSSEAVKAYLDPERTVSVHQKNKKNTEPQMNLRGKETSYVVGHPQKRTYALRTCQ